MPINAYVSYIHEQPVHSHNNDLEIIIALKGTIKVIVGYRTLLLKEGEMFIFNDRDTPGTTLLAPTEIEIGVTVHM